VDEIGHTSQRIGKKEWLIIGGAAASIVALVVLTKRSGTGSTLAPSRAPVGGTAGQDQTLQATIAAANIKLQEQKLAQEATIAAAQYDLQKVALGTQYAIAAKQADAQTLRTALGGGGIGPAVAGDLGKLIDALFKKKETPGTAAPPGFGNLNSAPGPGLWERLSQLWPGLLASNDAFAKYADDNNPSTYDTISQQGYIEHTWQDLSNTLPYETGGTSASESGDIYNNIPESTSEGEGFGGGWL
jgi:hypothetical protein